MSKSFMGIPVITDHGLPPQIIRLQADSHLIEKMLGTISAGEIDARSISISEIEAGLIQSVDTVDLPDFRFNQDGSWKYGCGDCDSWTPTRQRPFRHRWGCRRNKIHTCESMEDIADRVAAKLDP